MEVDPTIVAAVIAAGGTIAVALITRQLRQIHVLVNSRLSRALEEIATLKNALVRANRIIEDNKDSQDG